MAKTLKPLIYVVDDDRDIRKFLEVSLRGFGMTPELFGTPEDFLKAIKERRPDACLIDVNIGRARTGFLLVQAVRNVLGPLIPLIIVSSLKDRSSIAHGLELGASDYVAKPIDSEALAKKLSQYVVAKELEDRGPKFVSSPGDGPSVLVDLELEIAAVDEFGMSLVGPHLLSKGSVVRLSSPHVSDITEQKEVLVTVDSTWIAEEGTYGAYVEFDQDNEGLLRGVRRWLQSQA